MKQEKERPMQSVKKTLVERGQSGSRPQQQEERIHNRKLNKATLQREGCQKL
jgi:hypothetical protein